MVIDISPLLIAASIRAFGLAVAVIAGLVICRVKSPAVRHAIWTVVLAGMLLQIPLGLMPTMLAVKSPRFVAAAVQLQSAASARTSVLPVASVPQTNVIRAGPKNRRIPKRGILTGLYLMISFLLFLRIAFGCAGLLRLFRTGRPIPDLGPGVYESALIVVPLSGGCFRAGIFLPKDWRNWDPPKLRAVLAHERAHTRRRDWLVRFASQINVCIFWFHPVAWWLERQLAALAEEACDDLATSELRNSEQYAETLIDMARAAASHGGILNWTAIPMATDSNLFRRVERILENDLQVRRPFGRLAWTTLLVCSLPVIYLSAAVRLAPPGRDATAVARQEMPVLTVRKEQSPVKQFVQLTPPRRPPQDRDALITMCIVIDNSGSMRNKRDTVKALALSLVQASRPGDEVCVLNFNDEVYGDLPRDEDFTTNPAEMEEALTRIDSRGGKAMRDALLVSADRIRRAGHNARKVVVLITEGNDSASKSSQQQMLAALKESNVHVFAIGLLSGDDPRRAATARAVLSELAQASGGRDYFPADLAEAQSMLAGITNAARRR